MIDEKVLKHDLFTRTHRERFADYKSGGKGIYFLDQDIRDCIDRQPKVDNWIPCSERMPTMEECQKNDNRFILDDGNRRYQGYFDYTRKQFILFDGTGVTVDKCVIAWQPFPEKYVKTDSGSQKCEVPEEVEEALDRIQNWIALNFNPGYKPINIEIKGFEPESRNIKFEIKF